MPRPTDDDLAFIIPDDDVPQNDGAEPEDAGIEHTAPHDEILRTLDGDDA